MHRELEGLVAIEDKGVPAAPVLLALVLVPLHDLGRTAHSAGAGASGGIGCGEGMAWDVFSAHKARSKTHCFTASKTKTQKKATLSDRSFG